AGEAGAGKDDRLEEVAAGADRGDLGEVGPDASALRRDRVAGGAGGLLAEEDLFAADGIAADELGVQFRETCFLLLDVDLEPLEEGRRLVPDFFRIVLQRAAQRLERERLDRRRLLEPAHQFLPGL